MLCKWEGDNIRKVMACNGVEQVMVPIGGEYLEKSWLERMGASTLWPAHRARLARLLKRQVGIASLQALRNQYSREGTS